VRQLVWKARIQTQGGNVLNSQQGSANTTHSLFHSTLAPVSSFPAPSSSQAEKVLMVSPRL
jgi:hypothetical protein